tara:strand:- start:532 stop:657 length:126 start_codon:yes stop_codon:yes gene_type:complete
LQLLENFARFLFVDFSSTSKRKKTQKRNAKTQKAKHVKVKT